MIPNAFRACSQERHDHQPKPSGRWLVRPDALVLDVHGPMRMNGNVARVPGLRQ
jgi:hypothetical protein